MSVPERAAPRTTFPPGAIVAALCFGSLCASLMQSLVIPIQSELPQLLGTSPSNASWIVTATLLGGGVAMPVAGRLGDLIGKKPVLVASAVLLALGSLLCALSSSFLPVVTGRVLQGIAMGFIPVAISMVREVTPPRMASTAIATVSATLGVGGAPLARDGREPREHLALVADLAEQRRLRVLSDVVRDPEGAVGAGALGVHATLRDDLAVEVRELRQEPQVLQQQRAAGPGGEAVLVVAHRRTGGGGQRRSVVFGHLGSFVENQWLSIGSDFAPSC